MPPKRKTVKKEVKVEEPENVSQNERPTVADLQGDHPFAELAKKHWLKKVTKVKVKSDVIKNEIWNVLEKEDFPYQKLLVLENLQILER